MKCTNCKREAELHSGIKSGQYYTDLCEKCIGTLGSAEFSREFDRKSQRRTYARDIVQQWEPEYIKAYGPEKAREAGWSDEQIRRYG